MKKEVTKLEEAIFKEATIEEMTIEEAAAKNDWTQNYGQIDRLYPDAIGLCFRLKGGKTAMNPSTGYYRLPIDHPNYDVMSALILIAARSHYVLYAQTLGTLSKGVAIVNYLVVNWK